jgi:predicted DNA-binding transcriptional regulator AlpA
MTRTAKKTDPMNDGAGSVFVPDPQFARELGISLRTLDRWDKDEQLRLPKAVKIRNRKYRHRSAVDAFKAKALSDVLVIA